jgi:hypothetical protein
MKIKVAIKYISIFVFGYILLLALSYFHEDSAFQPIITLLTGISIFFCMKGISYLYNKFGAKYILIAIIIIGGLIRFLWAISIQTIPFSDFQYFHESALELSKNTPLLTKNMGYSLLLSGVYRIFPNILSGKLINALFSTLTIMFVYLTGSKLLDQKTGLIAAFLFACLPSEILMVSVIGTEIAATMLLIITAIMIFQINNISVFSNHFAFGAGLFYSLGLSVRSSFIFYFPAILLWILYISFREYKQLLRTLGLLIAGIAVGLIVVLGSFALTTGEVSIEPLMTQDSFPFLSGTNVKAKGIWNLEDADLYFSWPESERDKRAITEAIQRMKKYPIEYLRVIPEKYRVLMGSDDYGNYWSISEVNWENIRFWIGLFSQSFYVTCWIFAFIASLRYEDNLILPIVLVMVLFTLLPHTILEVSPRYHHYIMPFIALMAAVGDVPPKN